MIEDAIDWAFEGCKAETLVGSTQCSAHHRRSYDFRNHILSSVRWPIKKQGLHL